MVDFSLSVQNGKALNKPIGNGKGETLVGNGKGTKKGKIMHHLCLMNVE